jgi:hypothetical protein
MTGVGDVHKIITFLPIGKGHIHTNPYSVGLSHYTALYVGLSAAKHKSKKIYIIMKPALPQSSPNKRRNIFFYGRNVQKGGELGTSL